MYFLHLSWVCFWATKDTRDQRPMAYSGKFISPHQSTLDVAKEQWLWKDSALNRLRRTVGEAKQIPAKAMIVMEEVGSTALPGATSVPHGAPKYSQLGSDAAEQLVMSALVSGWNLGDSS